MKKKLAVVYNFAQLYREPIFKLIDKTWDCTWYFGKTDTDIKEMDTSLLKEVVFVNNKSIIGPVQIQSCIGKVIRNPEVNKILILGEPKVLSTWWILMQKRLFFRKKKVYLWSHGWYGREGFVKKWIKRLFFGMADHVFTYGEYARNVAIEQGYDKDKITPIHNSLNHSVQVSLRNQLSPSEIFSKHFENTQPTLLFIGRLTKIKRLDILIEALFRLKADGNVFNLVLIGDGECKDELQNLVREKGLSKEVWFFGKCYDDNEVAQLIYDADLCVAPGNVGLTAMHAMVFGCPVLTHDNYSLQMPEFESIKQDKTGSFFQYGDRDSLAEVILDWFTKHKSDRD